METVMKQTDLKALALQVLLRKPERKLAGNTPQCGRKLLPIKKPEKFPQVARSRSWLISNEAALKKAGFTDRDIYGNGTWFIGIADLSIWQKDNLRVELRGDTLVFNFHNEHQTITQQCRPGPRVRK